jgi:lysophospholipid acyltransferase (LPLAT)-like uncharacterized protein
MPATHAHASRPAPASDRRSLSARLKTALWRLATPPVSSALLAYTRLVFATSRVTEVGPGAGFRGPAIYVNWHRYLPFLVPMHGRAKRSLMISPAPHMAPIARWSERGGLLLVPGATGERGREALEELSRRLRDGGTVFIAVDGPAGPAHVVKRGCVDLAKASGAPIIPVAYATKRGFSNRTRWDESLIVAPYDDITVTYGEPLRIGAEEPVEASCERVAAALRAVSA